MINAQKVQIETFSLESGMFQAKVTHLPTKVTRSASAYTVEGAKAIALEYVEKHLRDPLYGPYYGLTHTLGECI